MNEPSTHESKKGNSFYPAFEAVSQTANITAIVPDLLMLSLDEKSRQKT